MIETVLAVLVITFLFLTLFRLSHLLTGKIVLEHAAMRVARARAVGCNHFMCLKAARISVIPAAGERIVPDKDDEREGISEPALARRYMGTPDSSYAGGLLQYEYWPNLEINYDNSGMAHTSLKTDWFTVKGEAQLDNFPVYLNDGGL